MWVDAHLHLDDTAFDLDRDAVIARAREAGVRWMVSAGTSLAGSRHVLELAGRYPQVAAAVGIHPAAAAEATPDGLAARWIVDAAPSSVDSTCCGTAWTSKDAPNGGQAPDAVLGRRTTHPHRRSVESRLRMLSANAGSRVEVPCRVWAMS